MARPRRINEKAIYIKPELEEILKNVEDYPVTFIGAPAGYGKTVLISHLEKTRKVIRFVVTAESREDFRQEFIDVTGDIETWKAGRDTGSICVVIENIHDLNDEKMLDIIYALACEPDSIFRFVITSRINYYTENSPEVIRGNVNLVGPQMLLLLRHEIIAYFGTCGVKIDADAADLIYNRTGGCINIIFGVLKKYIRTGKLTFTDEVTNHLYQTQLVYITPSEETAGNRLALMGQFTLDEAEMTMNYIAKQEFLEQKYMFDLKVLLDSLCRKNYFIYYDAKEGKYIFNDLFRNKLMDLYHKNYPEELEAMQEIIADVHAEMGYYSQAAYYYFLCGDQENMFRALTKDNRISFEMDNREAYIRYFRETSRSVRAKYPMAVLYLAWRYFIYGELELYEAASSEFLEDVESNTEISEEQRRSLMCDYHLFCGMTCYYDLGKMKQHYENALAVFDGVPRTYHTIVPRTFGSTSVMRIVYNGGSMNSLIEKLRKITEAGNIMIGNRWRGYDSLTEAEMYFLRMDYSKSKVLIEKAIRECRESNRPYGGAMVSLSFLKGQIALMEGDADLLKKEMFYDGIPEIYGINSVLGKTAELCKAWMYIQLDMAEKIEPWIKSGNFSALRFLYPAIASVYIIYIYAQLALGKFTRVLSYEDYFFGKGVASENLLIREEACMIFAAAASELGKVSVARRYFEEALDIAVKTENYATIVLYGDRLMPLFSDVPEHHREIAVSLMKKTRGFVVMRKKIRMKLDAVRTMGLTEKEMQVARCAAKGYTNKEIAKEISISENTVKSTLKRIFSKLNINSRRQLSDMVKKYQ